MAAKSSRQTAIVYAETRLEPWGKWSRDSAEALGLPKVSIIHKIMRRKLIRGLSKNKNKMTAKGKETLSFRPKTIGEATEAVAEVDKAVAEMPQNLIEVVKVEYILCPGDPIERRCAVAGKSKSAYHRALDTAKYKVFVLLEACAGT